MELYYTPPSDEVFNEVKEKIIELFNEKSKPYSTKKIEFLEGIKNTEGKFMLMINMLDFLNQKKLAGMLSEKTRVEIRKRMKSGGSMDHHIVF